MRTAFSAILIAAAIGAAPAAPQDQLQAYIAQLDRLDAQAKAAYDREMTRAAAAEKAGECPQAGSTRATEECLAKEISATQANCAAFTGAIRSILALDAPGDRNPVAGPTGVPLSRTERLQQFDDVAAAWSAYSKAQVSGAYDLWKGGTIAPVESLTCELMLLRSRMRELNRIYDAQLRHR